MFIDYYAHKYIFFVSIQCYYIIKTCYLFFYSKFIVYDLLMNKRCVTLLLGELIKIDHRCK